MFYKYLIQQGKDVQWLAKKVGVSHQTIYNWINNKAKPRPAHLKKISSVLSIPLSKLVKHYY